MPSGATDSTRAAGDAKAAALVGVGALLLYARTLYPDVAGGDSGELVAAVGGGGVIHPPGYPAYALLGQVFSHLPLGNLAQRLNLLSAVCDAAAAALLFLATARSTRSRAAGLVAAALFSSAPSVWRYATAAEVFALNNLFVAGLLLIAVTYEATRAWRVALAGAFAIGLGLSNHQTSLFAAAPLAAWVLWTGREVGLVRPGRLVRLALAGAAGLLPYAYLPIAASRHAPVTWGAADTWAGFWTHVLRREYGTFQLAPTGIAGPGASATEMIGAFASSLREDLGPAGLALALVGAALSLREASRRRLGPGLVALGSAALSVGVMATLGNLPVGDALHRGIVARFWQQPTLFVCFLTGSGFALLSGRLPPRAAKAPWGVAVGAAALAVGLRCGEMDRSRATLVRQYGAEYLRAAPPGALLFTKGDLITNTVRYLQLAEHLRPDVEVVDQELLAFAWMVPEVERRYPDVALPPAEAVSANPTYSAFRMKELLDANVPRRRVLVCGGVKAGDLTADATYGQWPMGFCDEMRSGSRPVDVDRWIEESAAALPRIDFSGHAHPKGSWEDIVWSDYWEVRQTRAAHLVEIAGRDPGRRKYIALAAELLQEIVTENPAVPAHVYKNLAVALGRAGLETPEQRARAASAWEHYLAGSPAGDPQLPAIEEEVRRLRAADR